MRSETLSRTLWFVFFMVALAAWPSAKAEIPGTSASAEDVRTALDDLHRWLGDNDNGMAWRAYLRSDELSTELDKGLLANRRKLAEIQSLFSGSTAGLDRPKFVAVRNSLTTWLSVLPVRTDDLPTLVRDAKDDFQPLPLARVQTARRELQQALAALDRFLSRGSAANAAAWKDYLGWNDITAALAADPPDLRLLGGSTAKFYRNEVGLELPQFTRVRQAMRDYMNRYTFATSDRVEELYQSQLEALAASLEAYQQDPNRDRAEEIGELVGWLVRAEQADHVVQAVRAHYWHPNLMARVSRRFIAAGIDDTVDETISLRDNILGTSITGTAHTTGRIGVQLVPNREAAQLAITLDGQAHSDNVGLNRGVTIYSTGITSIQAQKALLINSDGLYPYPAWADCHTRTSINGLCAKNRLIERIAWKKVDKSQSDAECIASQRAEKRVASSMDERSAELLDKASTTYQDKFRDILIRRGEFPEGLGFSTTTEDLLVEFLQVNMSQLAAPSDPPPEAAHQDLSVRVHETFVSNFSRALLAGVTLTDERLEQILEDTTGEVPEEIRVTPDKDPWSITFSSTQPVSAQFSGDTIRFAIRGRRFTQGDREIRDTVEMSAAYTLQKTDLGARLTRTGDVSVEYVGVTGTLTPAQIALRTLLRNKFEALFKPEFETTGLQVPGRWEEAGALQLEQMRSDGGWLTLGWLLPQPPQVAGK